MITDIFTRLYLRVALHPKPEPFIQLNYFLAREAVKNFVIIRMDIIHESLQIWSTPLTLQVSVAKAQLALTQ